MSGSLKPLFGSLIPGLDALASKAAAAHTLTDKVRARLPDALRPHLISASRRRTDLIVIMDSAAWTARVRYAGRALKDGLEADGEPAIGKLHVKVRAAVAAAER
jgi:hypothetical protein